MEEKPYSPCLMPVNTKSNTNIKVRLMKGGHLTCELVLNWNFAKVEPSGVQVQVVLCTIINIPHLTKRKILEHLVVHVHHQIYNQIYKEQSAPVISS